MPSDRLSALDAAFLHLESPGSPLHFGAVAICDGPPPAADELVALIEQRIGRVARYRHRLGRSPLDRGRPRWVEDPAFRVEAHVHHTALAAPGGRAELFELVARVFATPLDRGRALWELWLVEGLEDSSFALLFKTHHALVDGLAGVEVARAVLDGGEDGAVAVASDGPGARRPAGPHAARRRRRGEGRRPARARGGIAGAGTRQDARRRAGGGSRASSRSRASSPSRRPTRPCARAARAGVRDGLVRAGGPHAARTRRSTTCCWRRSRARCGAF